MLEEYIKSRNKEFDEKYQDLFFPYGGDSYDFDIKACKSFQTQTIIGLLEKMRWNIVEMTGEMRTSETDKIISYIDDLLKELKDK